jgi:hypothetical protein
MDNTYPFLVQMMSVEMIYSLFKNARHVQENSFMPYVLHGTCYSAGTK